MAVSWNPGITYGNAPMSANVTTFLTEWLRLHVVGRVASSEDVPALVAKCLADAADHGISERDIDGAVGSLENCIRMSLRRSRKDRRK